MNWENAKITAEVVNKWVVTAAVLVGGVWAILTFNAELKRENAQAQLQQAERQLQRLGVESLVASVAATALTPLGSELLVKVEVVIKNIGMVELTVPIEKGSLRITPILAPNFPEQPTLANNSQVRPIPLITDVKGRLGDVKSLRVPAGGENRLLYVAQIDSPGRYLVEFSSPTRRSDGSTKPDAEWSIAEVLEISAKVAK